MPRKIKILKGNKCGVKVDLKNQQEAGKSTEGKGPANRGWTQKQ